MTKSKRSGKIFLDWSQNAGSKTTLSPYSLRGLERPTVATPVTWDEVEEGAEDPLALEQFRYDEVLARVAGARRSLHRLSGYGVAGWLPSRASAVAQSLPCLT